MGKEKITRVFQMTPDVAEKFFFTVQQLKQQGFEDTPELRRNVLQALMEMGYMDRVYDTKRSEDEIVSDLRQKGFDVRDERSRKTLWQKIKQWFVKSVNKK